MIAATPMLPTKTPNIYALEIGQRLKESRLERNYTQEYVAQMLAVSWRHYNRLEHGTCFPSTNTRRCLRSLFPDILREMQKIYGGDGEYLRLLRRY